MQKRYRPFRTSDIARCEVLVIYELDNYIESGGILDTPKMAKNYQQRQR